MSKLPRKNTELLEQIDVQGLPEPGTAVDLEARKATRESGRVVRPSTAEIRYEVMRLSHEKNPSDFEAGLLVALEWTMGERKTLKRPGK